MPQFNFKVATNERRRKEITSLPKSRFVEFELSTAVGWVCCTWPNIVEGLPWTEFHSLRLLYRHRPVIDYTSDWSIRLVCDCASHLQPNLPSIPPLASNRLCSPAASFSWIRKSKKEIGKREWEGNNFSRLTCDEFRTDCPFWLWLPSLAASLFGLISSRTSRLHRAPTSVCPCEHNQSISRWWISPYEQIRRPTSNRRSSSDLTTIQCLLFKLFKLLIIKLLII